MSEVEEAHRAVERSRGERYLDHWDEATHELTTAAEGLRHLEVRLRSGLPAEAHRVELAAELNAFKAELRLAQRIHEQAGAWEQRWANAVRDALGLEAAAYGPDGTALSGDSIRRSAWEG